MGWDGSGNFSRTNGTQSGATTWADAKTAGNNITTSQHDTHDQDLATGIGASLTKNNETKPTADFRGNADATYSLGSSALRWVNLWLSGALKIVASGNTGTVQMTPTGNRTVTIPDATGTLKMSGKETIWIPAASFTPRITNGPSQGTTELATNDVMLRTLDFDQTTSEGAQFMILMPKSWDESTVTFKAVWTAASGTGDVTWNLAGVAFSNDDAMDAARGTAVGVTDTLITANDAHMTSESAAVTIAGTPAEGDLVCLEISRDIADTLNADAKLIGVHVYITTNAGNDT